jgi:DNA-binding ferritin-like protein
MSEPYRTQIRPINEAVNPASSVSNKTPSWITGLNSKELLQECLAALRALQMNYQTSHWHVGGKNFYEYHLLFERLYASAEKEIDVLAEKLVAYYGDKSVDLKDSLKRMERWIKNWPSGHVEGAIHAEKDIQTVLSYAYGELKRKDEISLGLDDFMMATANAHETNLYLLGQTQKGS